jgi:DNA-binding transcriptional MerR regulator
MHPQHDEDLLTTAEVAEILRAPISTVRYWRHIGGGPARFRLGRRVLYRRCDVETSLDGVRTSQMSAS